MATVMGAMATYEDYKHCWPVPSAAKLPIELDPPEGFDPGDLGTWPRVEGRLEWVDGRLLYMPPCGEFQMLISAQITGLLFAWVEKHPEFELGTNDAGLWVGKDVRGIDAAIWKRPPAGTPRTHGLRTTMPLLAVEVAGRDQSEDESGLLRKGRKYLRHGVKTVWLLLPESREVIVLRGDRTKRFETGDALPAPPELRALAITVDEIFRPL